jgi:hypothetical protein
MENENKELQLIAMVQNLEANWAKYSQEVRDHGSSRTQLDTCKGLQKKLRAYCEKRKKEIESKQQKLF